MGIDFNKVLNESNSTKNEETGEITLTSPMVEIDDSILITTPCKITSNCNTVIKCKNFSIELAPVSIDGITFETTLEIVYSENSQIKNCNLKVDKIKSDGVVVIKNSKNIEIENVTISNNDDTAGIYITEKSSVVINNLSIHDFSDNLIVCNNESVLHLKNSYLHDTKSNGIFSEKSHIKIENCTFSNIIYPAIYAINSSFSILNNEISNVAENGIALVKAIKNSTIENSDQDSLNVIKGNKITDINGSAISVMDNSTVSIEENVISNIQCNGIYVSNKSKIVECKNEISDCQYPAIVILMNSEASLKNSKISNTNYSGISIRDAKKVTVDDVEIQNCQDCGISISDTKDCIIRGSTISDCNTAAIEASNQSKVEVIGNTISNIKEHAFLAFTLAEIKAEENDISCIGKAMVKLIVKGGGDFINNKISNCPIQLDGQTSSQFYFEKNGDFPSITNDDSRKTDSIALEEKCNDANILCLKCNQNCRDHYLLNCCHKVYCQNCANEALQNHENCPLCRLPISNVSPGYEITEDICEVCFDCQPNCIIMPCCHIGYCKECLEEWFLQKRSCPFCHLEPVTFKPIHNF